MRSCLFPLITLACFVSACGDPELSTYQTTMVAQCIRAGIEDNYAEGCKDVTAAMERSFLKIHPNYHAEIRQQIEQERLHLEAARARFDAERAAQRRDMKLRECARAGREVIGECPRGEYCTTPILSSQREKAGRLCAEFSEAEIKEAVLASRAADTAAETAEQDATERARAAVSGAAKP